MIFTRPDTASVLLLRYSLSKNLLIPSLSTLFYPRLRVNKKVQTSEAKELLCRWEVVGCGKVWRFHGILAFQFEFVAKFANCSLLFTVLEIKDFFRFYSGFNTASNFFWTNVTILWGGPHGIGKGPISLDWQWRKLQPSNQLLFMTKHIVKFNTAHQYCYMWR